MIYVNGAFARCLITSIVGIFKFTILDIALNLSTQHVKTASLNFQKSNYTFYRCLNYQPLPWCSTPCSMRRAHSTPCMNFIYWLRSRINKVSWMNLTIVLIDKFITFRDTSEHYLSTTLVVHRKPFFIESLHLSTKRECVLVGIA